MKKMTGEWLKAAEDDLRAAFIMKDEESLTAVVSFHCQQAVEKCLKAVMEEYGSEVPRVHTLKTLHKMAMEHLRNSFDENLISKLDAMYINSRYPGTMGLLPDGKPDITESCQFYEFAKYVYKDITGILKRNV